MEEVLAEYRAEMARQGYIVEQFHDEVITTMSPARRTYDAIYVSFNPAGFAMFREGFEAAAKVAREAKLPTGYLWGRDAMEQFDFGKERAAKAILGEE